MVELRVFSICLTSLQSLSHWGGSISGTLASNKLQDFIAGLKSITLTFKEVPQDPAAVIRNIIDLSNTARKEGLLALEEAANGIEDEFLKKESCLW